MTFWSANNVEPTRQYRFIISNTSYTGKENGDEVWWWAKSCDKPVIEIESQEHKLINHKFKYPGVATWNDIKITIVDIGEKAKDLMTLFVSSGWNIGGFEDLEREIQSWDDGITKNKSEFYLGEILIYQMDSNGKSLEKWTLKNAWAKSITFGSLDYSSDELVTIDITLAYDYAIFSTK